jgi:hypothetical protein
MKKIEQFIDNLSLLSKTRFFAHLVSSITIVINAYFKSMPINLLFFTLGVNLIIINIIYNWYYKQKSE